LYGAGYVLRVRLFLYDGALRGMQEEALKAILLALAFFSDVSVRHVAHCSDKGRTEDLSEFI
ncbi:hypothetical protein, partial [Rothia sp. 88186D007BW]